MKPENSIIGKMPDFSRPVLFLDFDSVINLGAHYTPPLGEDRHIIHAGREFSKVGADGEQEFDTIHLSYYREVVDTLCDLNCVWISSWKRFTQTKLNPLLGFDFGYIDWKYRGPSDYGMYGKMCAIEDIIVRHGIKDAVVVDDSLWEIEDRFAKSAFANITVIAPDSEVGLSDDECKQIIALMSQ